MTEARKLADKCEAWPNVNLQPEENRMIVAALRSPQPGTLAREEVDGRAKRLRDNLLQGQKALDAAMTIIEAFAMLPEDASPNLKRAHEVRRSLISATRYEFKTTVLHDLDAITLALTPSHEAGTQEPVAWREINGKTPTDRFIIMWCREDDSYWWAKWQGGMWHGVDDLGLTRDYSENFTPDLWREIPRADAAPASQDATRKATIAECAKLADKVATDLSQHSKKAEDRGDTQTMYRANTAWHRVNEVAELIRALASPARADDREKAAFPNKSCQSNGEEA